MNSSCVLLRFSLCRRKRGADAAGSAGSGTCVLHEPSLLYGQRMCVRVCVMHFLSDLFLSSRPFLSAMRCCSWWRRSVRRWRSHSSKTVAHLPPLSLDNASVFKVCVFGVVAVELYWSAVLLFDYFIIYMTVRLAVIDHLMHEHWSTPWFVSDRIDIHVLTNAITNGRPASQTDSHRLVVKFQVTVLRG